MLHIEADSPVSSVPKQWCPELGTVAAGFWSPCSSQYDTGRNHSNAGTASEGNLGTLDYGPLLASISMIGQRQSRMAGPGIPSRGEFEEKMARLEGGGPAFARHCRARTGAPMRCAPEIPTEGLSEEKMARLEGRGSAFARHCRARTGAPMRSAHGPEIPTEGLSEEKMARQKHAKSKKLSPVGSQRSAMARTPRH